VLPAAIRKQSRSGVYFTLAAAAFGIARAMQRIISVQLSPNYRLPYNGYRSTEMLSRVGLKRTPRMMYLRLPSTTRARAHWYRAGPFQFGSWMTRTIRSFRPRRSPMSATSIVKFELPVSERLRSRFPLRCPQRKLLLPLTHTMPKKCRMSCASRNASVSSIRPATSFLMMISKEAASAPAVAFF